MEEECKCPPRPAGLDGYVRGLDVPTDVFLRTSTFVFGNGRIEV